MCLWVFGFGFGFVFCCLFGLFPHAFAIFISILILIRRGFNFVCISLVVLQFPSFSSLGPRVRARSSKGNCRDSCLGVC